MHVQTSSKTGSSAIPTNISTYVPRWQGKSRGGARDARVVGFALVIAAIFTFVPTAGGVSTGLLDSSLPSEPQYPAAMAATCGGPADLLTHALNEGHTVSIATALDALPADELPGSGDILLVPGTTLSIVGAATIDGLLLFIPPHYLASTGQVTLEASELTVNGAVAAMPFQGAGSAAILTDNLLDNHLKINGSDGLDALSIAIITGQVSVGPAGCISTQDGSAGTPVDLSCTAQSGTSPRIVTLAGGNGGSGGSVVIETPVDRIHVDGFLRLGNGGSGGYVRMDTPWLGGTEIQGIAGSGGSSGTLALNDDSQLFQLSVRPSTFAAGFGGDGGDASVLLDGSESNCAALQPYESNAQAAVGACSLMPKFLEALPCEVPSYCESLERLFGTCGLPAIDACQVIQGIVDEFKLESSQSQAKTCVPDIDPCDHVTIVPGTCDRPLPDVCPIVQEIVDDFQMENSKSANARVCVPNVDECVVLQFVPGQCGSPPACNFVPTAMPLVCNHPTPNLCPIVEEIVKQFQTESSQSSQSLVCIPTINPCIALQFVPGECGSPPACTRVPQAVPAACGHPTPDYCEVAQGLIDEFQIGHSQGSNIGPLCIPQIDTCIVLHAVPGQCGSPTACEITGDFSVPGWCGEPLPALPCDGEPSPECLEEICLKSGECVQGVDGESRESLPFEGCNLNGENGINGADPENPGPDGTSGSPGVAGAKGEARGGDGGPGLAGGGAGGDANATGQCGGRGGGGGHGESHFDNNGGWICIPGPCDDDDTVGGNGGVPARGGDGGGAEAFGGVGGDTVFGKGGNAGSAFAHGAQGGDGGIGGNGGHGCPGGTGGRAPPAGSVAGTAAAVMGTPGKSVAGLSGDPATSRTSRDNGGTLPYSGIDGDNTC